MVAWGREYPYLIDMSWGRLGSFSKAVPVRDGIVDVYYYPLGFSLKENVIHNVPEKAIIHKPKQGRMPGDMVILLAGENGEAPLLTEFLGDEVVKLIKTWHTVEGDLKISKAAVDTERRNMERGALESIHEFAKKIQEARKRLEDGGRPELRFRRSMFSGDEE